MTKKSPFDTLSSYYNLKEMKLTYIFCIFVKFKNNSLCNKEHTIAQLYCQTFI